MKSLDAVAVRSAYEGEFRTRLQESFWPSWRTNYIAHVERVQTATDAEWMTPVFQEALWDTNAIAGLGPGSSVTVEGAYQDKDIAQALLNARRAKHAQSPSERGAFLQAVNDDILGRVQKYNDRRPQARLVRLLASIFPDEVSCILDRYRLRQVMRALGLPQTRAGFVASHPILRSHIAAVVGAPADTQSKVDQSIFTWFLYEQVAEKPEEGAVTAGPKPDVVTNVPRLSLLPASVQRKGLTYVNSNVSLLVSVVRECEQGLSRPDLVSIIQREAPTLRASGSANNVISQAQGGLGLIAFQDNAYRPTERGAELLASPDPEQVLQPLLVGRVFGIGQLLYSLKDTPKGMHKHHLRAHLTSLMPTRKSLWAGNEIINWAVAAKLAKREADEVFLTEDGVAFAEALPDDFAEKWRLSELDADAEDHATANDPARDEPIFTPAALADVLNHFHASRLLVPKGFLAQLHGAVHASERKRFVLLAGLSGTGKTSIARAYAQAYCSALGLDDWRERYAQVAVRPDWSDPSGLLGYVNAITEPPSFQGAEALRLLLAADFDRGRPYFLCLDEMNLARVEHYFAPFLSAMEGETGELALHGHSDAIDNVPAHIAWPTNLFVFGTVNMDESTHPFSDKVLDRAFTFELWDVDLNAWAEAKKTSGVPAALLNEVASLLQRLYDCLYPARRHFGYRSADEILSYCQACSKALPLAEALDSAVLMKILPRVRGDDSGPLSDALTKLNAALAQASLPRSLAKVAQMQASLERLGQARFWS